MRCNCSCIFCQEDGEDENDLAFYEEFGTMEKEVRKLQSDREEFLKRLEKHEQSFYSSSKCRIEVDLHRKMYKLGKEKSVTP